MNSKIRRSEGGVVRIHSHLLPDLLIFLFILLFACPASALVWPDVAERVEHDLQAADAPTRRNAARELAELGPKRGGALALEALGDPDDEVRLAAADAAIRLRTAGATDAVAPWLEAQDAKLRRKACEVARALPAPRVVAPLARTLGDPDPDVRAAAAEAMGHQYVARCGAAAARAPRRPDAGRARADRRGARASGRPEVRSCRSSARCAGLRRSDVREAGRAARSATWATRAPRRRSSRFATRTTTCAATPLPPSGDCGRATRSTPSRPLRRTGRSALLQPRRRSTAAPPGASRRRTRCACWCRRSGRTRTLPDRSKRTRRCARRSWRRGRAGRCTRCWRAPRRRRWRQGGVGARRGPRDG